MKASISKGQRVIFTDVPQGSYLRIGEVYIVESITQGQYYFRNESRGSGTFEYIGIVNRSKFTVL